jgi:hypothetical protein
MLMLNDGPSVSGGPAGVSVIGTLDVQERSRIRSGTAISHRGALAPHSHTLPKSACGSESRL